MHKDKWVFYTDLFGGQRWERLDPAGSTVAESITCFSTLSDAMADASRSGYLPGDGYAACVLEWRREPVAAVRTREENAA